MELIKEWDVDGNRQVSKREFHHVAQFMARGDMTKHESAEIFKMFDEDGAGTLSFFEIERVIKSFADHGERARW